jgi:hypothetical protein
VISVSAVFAGYCFPENLLDEWSATLRITEGLPVIRPQSAANANQGSNGSQGHAETIGRISHLAALDIERGNCDM